MSEEHLLAYYRWDDRTHWKLDSMDRNPRGKPVLAYVNYNDKLWENHAKAGSVVWVVGLGPDEAPTLEARIPVASRFPQTDEKGRLGWRVESAPGRGTFFGLNHAAPEIMQLVFANEKKKNWSLRERQGSTVWVRRHGLHLRATRRIAAEGELTTANYVSPGIRPLRQLERRALEKSIFISWKHDDNKRRREFLLSLTVALSKLGHSVWLDQVELGRAARIARRKDSRKLMRRLLRQGLERTAVVLAVWTRNYGKPSRKRTPGARRDNWTKREWEDIKDVTRLALVPGGRPAPKAGLTRPDGYIAMPENPGAGDVEVVAGSIAAKFAATVPPCPPSCSS